MGMSRTPTYLTTRSTYQGTFQRTFEMIRRHWIDLNCNYTSSFKLQFFQPDLPLRYELAVPAKPKPTIIAPNGLLAAAIEK